MMKILLPAAFAAFSLVTAVAATPARAAGADAAAQPVAKLQDALIATMKAGKSLDYSARYKKLDPVVGRTFDFKFIARLVLGADWSKLSADQQQHFVAELDRLSTSSYAKEFDSYSGEHFDFVSERDVAGGKLVRYAFKTGDGKSINFDYQLHQSDGSWKVANVIVDGVSDLALKRGQYRKLLSDRGYKGLIAWIKKQIDANAG